MIKLKINGSWEHIPTVSELSTEQFLKLLKLKEFNIVDYLSIALGISDKLSKQLKVKNLPFLESQLYGDIPDYEISKPRKSIVINGRNYKLSNDFTIGQRITIEESGKKLSEHELIILILAVSCDSEKYDDLTPHILKAPASRVLPEAFFLLQNLSNGQSYARNFIKVLLRIMIQIKKLKNKRV